MRWRALLLLAPSLPAEVQSQNKCENMGKVEDEQGPLWEASEPAEPQLNIKKSERQLMGTGDSHLYGMETFICYTDVMFWDVCWVPGSKILKRLSRLVWSLDFCSLLSLPGHQGHIRSDSEAVGLRVKDKGSGPFNELKRLG